MATPKQKFQVTKRVNHINAAVNLLQALLKTLAGAIGHSPALFADGIHSFSDLLTNLLVSVANHYAHLEPDENHPYGHQRFETFASLTLGVFLILVAAGIAYDGIERVLMHHILIPDRLTLLVALLSVIMNEMMFRYSLNAAKSMHSALLKANAYHNRADSLSSVIVLIGLLAEFAGWHLADAIAAVLVAGFIMRMGLKLAWQAGYELTDAGVSDNEARAMGKVILSLSGVRHMHRLRTRKMANRIFLDVHILIAPYSSASEGHYIAETVRFALMHQFADIEDVTVHVDTENHPEVLPKNLLPARRDILDKLMPLWEMHIGKGNISEVLLYYFDRHLEMTLVLTANTGLDQDKISQLEMLATSAFPEIVHIKIQQEILLPEHSHIAKK